MSKIQVGRIVTYFQDGVEKPFNGHRDHPAIVTHVFGDDCVNLKVFFDCGPVEDCTSVMRLKEGMDLSRSYFEQYEPPLVFGNNSPAQPAYDGLGGEG